jgi:hypothetical protein
MGARSLGDEAALGADASDLSEGDRRLDGTLDPATLARTRAELAAPTKEFFATRRAARRLRAETAHEDADGTVRRGPAPQRRQLALALTPGISADASDLSERDSCLGGWCLVGCSGS